MPKFLGGSSESDLTKNQSGEESEGKEKTAPPTTASERFVEMFRKATEQQKE